MDQWMTAEQNSPDKHGEIIQFMTPFACAILKRWFQISLTVSGIYLLYVAALYISVLPDYGVAKYNAYKFEIVIQDIDWPSGAGNSTGSWYGLNVTLLRQGCVVFSSYISSIRPGNNSRTLVADSAQSIEMDGFSLALSGSEDGSVADAAIAGFALFGSPDGGASWHTAAALSSRFVPMGVRFLSAQGVPAARQAADFSPPWPLVQANAVDSVLFALGCLLCAFCGAFRRTAQARTLLTWACFLLAINGIAAGVGLMALGLRRDALVPLTDGAIYALMVASLAHAERYFFDCLRFSSLFALLFRLLHSCTLYQDCAYLAQDPPVRDILVFAAGFTFILLRDRFLFGSMDAVVADRERADARWTGLVADPVAYVGSRALVALAEELADACAAKPARHLNRLRMAAPRSSVARGGTKEGEGVGACGGGPCGGGDGAQLAEKGGSGGRERVSSLRSLLLSGGAGAMAAAERAEGLRGYDRCETIPGTADPESPVTSLDQLYAQAIPLCPRLPVSSCARACPLFFFFPKFLCCCDCKDCVALVCGEPPPPRCLP